jgi:hypothetical protein
VHGIKNPVRDPAPLIAESRMNGTNLHDAIGATHGGPQIGAIAIAPSVEAIDTHAIFRSSAGRAGIKIDAGMDGAARGAVDPQKR